MSITVTSIQNPFEPEINIKNIYESEEDKTLNYYLKHINLEVEDINFTIGLNGYPVDIDDINSTIVPDDSKIAVCAKIEATAVAGFVFSYIAPLVGAGVISAGVGLTIIGAAYIATTFAIGYGLSALASALGPDPPSMASLTDTGSSIAVQSTYGWGDLQQTTGEGNNVPLLFGTNRIPGQEINKFVTIDGDKEVLNIFLGLCDHEVDSISDVYINGQPSVFFKGVDIHVRLGTNSDAIIEGFDETVTQSDIGSKLNISSAVLQQTSGTSVQKLIISIVAPNGLYYSNTSGGIDSRTATFDVDYRAVGAGSWIPFSSEVMSGATNKTQRKEIIIDSLSPDQYEVRITRTNAAESSLRGNSEIYFSFLQEIVKEAFIYPGLAKYAIKVLATDQLSGSSPRFSCLTSRNTVQVFDYDLETPIFVSKRATNPAWICYSLLVTYAGIDKDRLVWEDFSTWADYCDEDIDGEYRFDANVIIYTGNFWGEIQKIARLGRASVLRRGTRYGVFVDKYEGVTPTISHLFSMGNILDGSFKLQYLSKKDRANAVDIEYTDKDKEYTRQTLAVYSDDYLASDTEQQRVTVSIEASISQEEAVREGIFRINSNMFLNRTINFDVFVDSFAAVVGDLFYFQHIIPDYSLGLGGRIIDAGNDDGGGNPYVQMDQEFTLESGKTYSILVRLRDNSIIEKIADNAPGITDTLTLTTPWSTVPTINGSEKPPFSFGDVDVYKKIYRLIGATRKDDFIRTITGIEYIEEVYQYNDDYVVIEADFTPRKPTAIHVTLHEFLSYRNDGSYKSNINVSWTRAYSQDGANWTIWLENTTAGTEPENIGDSFENSIIISDGIVIGDTYKIYVVEQKEGATDTGDNTASIAAQGKLAPPSNVINFNGIWDSIKRQVHFVWPAISDIDKFSYEIREGAVWSTGDVVATTTSEFVSIFIDEGVDDIVTYKIKAIDTSGIYSETEDSDDVTIDTSESPLNTPTTLALSSTSIIASDGRNIVEMLATWVSGGVSDDFLHYEVELEYTIDNKVSTFQTQNLQYQWELIPNREYGVRVRAVDFSGSSTDYTSQELHTTVKDTTAPATPTWPVSDFAIGGFRVVGLDWDANTESDLSHYILERSTTGSFSGEEIVLGQTRATFQTDKLDLDVDTTYYYRIKAVDTSGNSSAYSAIKSALTLEIGSSDLAADSVIASKISVTDLEAISADFGEITAGIAKSTDGRFIIDLDDKTLKIYDVSAVLRVHLGFIP